MYVVHNNEATLVTHDHSWMNAMVDSGQMTLEECTKFFVSDGYQTPAVAEREAKRGTSDPTYLVYTLGKLEILKLRDDVKAKEGASFTLQKFPDDFLRQGFPPVKMIRETMLGNDSPVL